MRGAQDFVVQLGEALEASRVLIAVIGPRWLGTSTTTSDRPASASTTLPTTVRPQSSTLTVAAAGLVSRTLYARESTVPSTASDNVERVLQGRGISKDSALMPGVHEWRHRSRAV